MPERAVYWPARRTLLIADLHLGKTDTFRVHGVPVPAGLHEDQFRRLARAVRETDAERVLILGDILHAPVGLTRGLIDRVAQSRRMLPVAVEVVPGNHDRGLDSVASAWDLRVRPSAVREGGFEFRHDPGAGLSAGVFTWCGHLHPCVRLRAGGDALKLPCFHLSPRMGVLPAFTAFSSGGSVRGAPGDRVFAVAEDRVIALPSPADDAPARDDHRRRR